MKFDENKVRKCGWLFYKPLKDLAKHNSFLGLVLKRSSLALVKKFWQKPRSLVLSQVSILEDTVLTASLARTQKVLNCSHMIVVAEAFSTTPKIWHETVRIRCLVKHGVLAQWESESIGKIQHEFRLHFISNCFVSSVCPVFFCYFAMTCFDM